MTKIKRPDRFNKGSAPVEIVCNERADAGIRAELIALGISLGSLTGGRLCVVSKQQIELREIARDRRDQWFLDLPIWSEE